jgi:hypothetical protein
MSRRTTLRPIETTATKGPAGLATPDAPARLIGSASVVSRTGLMSAALLVTGMAVLVALLLGGNRSNPPASPEPVAAPVAASAPTTCPSAASFLDVMTSYERQARWSLAASAVQTALHTPGLCDSDRTALSQKLVTLSREALFEQPPSPEDAPGQRRVANAYSDLKTIASQYGVQPPAPLPIAQSAYDHRLFLLATAAYADAFTSGDSSAEDRDVVRADYAAQYNLGMSWAQRSDVKQRQEGLARLATACRIAERSQLGSAEACNELQTLVGSRSRWPAPLADPLIDARPSLATAHGG